MNYCLAENPEQCCLLQGGGYNLATLERRHLQQNEQNQAKQKQKYDRHSSEEKEILDIMRPIYARDTLSNIWITGTVLNRPQSIREPKTPYIPNVRGKVYKRTREHRKPRPTTNITNIPRQETQSPALNTDTTQKKKAISMATANKESNTQKNPTEYPTTPRERPSTVQKTYQLQSCITRSGRGHQDNRKI